MTPEEAAALTALCTAVVQPLVGIRDELRRMNERNDRFDAALLEFFERLTEQPGDEGSPTGSGQPAAAPDGQDDAEPSDNSGEF